jgi:hypothetical protein
MLITTIGRVTRVPFETFHNDEGSTAHRHTGTPAHRHTGTPAHRHTGTPAHRTPDTGMGDIWTLEGEKHERARREPREPKNTADGKERCAHKSMERSERTMPTSERNCFQRSALEDPCRCCLRFSLAFAACHRFNSKA